ncbi:hypothetical protein AX768_05510 [Burkholderia sp. PAMC 28687]|nr:hypothetical protein AX768_05510 [Burkholderia sp. PAMC 28687]
MAQSLIDASSMVSASLLMAIPFIPDADNAAITDPALVPLSRSTFTLRASSALITPICANPRAAPPPSARPMRTGRCGDVATGEAGVTPDVPAELDDV